jgi:hypothetical protein
VQPAGQGKNPSLARQALVTDVVNETVDLLEFGPQHLGVIEVGVPSIRFGCTSKITENMFASSWLVRRTAPLDRCDAINLDVEMPGPRRDVHEDPGGRILREASRIDRVHGRELLD